MAQVNQQKCANAECSCKVDTAGAYCSTECEIAAAGHSTSAHCKCGHEDYRKTPHAAKVHGQY